MPEKLIQFLNDSYWKYAKSMPKFPHWYIYRMKLDLAQDEMFIQTCNFINKNGYQGRFFRKILTYYDVGDWKLWTMGDPIHGREETIRRDKAKQPCTYILNLAHKNGLNPLVVDPNKTTFTEKVKDEHYTKDWKA